MAAIGTTPLQWDGTYTLKSDGSWRSREGNVIGTTNSNTVKQVARYHFTIPSSFNSTPVTIINKVGFFIGTKTNGTTATNSSVGWGMAQGSNFGMKFFISSSSTLTWANLSNGIGSFNNADMNDASQMPMTSSVSNTVGSNPSPTQYSVSTFNLKPGKTYYLYIFAPLSPNTSGSQRYWKTYNGTLEFTYETYTSCGAPKTLRVLVDTDPTSNTDTTSVIMKPTGQTAHVFIGGGTAGTENPLKGYCLYWRVGDYPTTSTYTGKLSQNTTTGSTIIKVPITNIASRGSVIYFKAVSLGKVSGFNSAISTDKNSCTVRINTLPSVPSIYYYKDEEEEINSLNSVCSSSQEYIKLSSNTKPGLDKNSPPQTLSIRYRIDGDSTYTNCSGGTTIKLGNPGEAKTFHFYTYDGLEYSAATTITVTRNIKPRVEFEANEGETYYYYDGENQKKYTTQPSVRITANLDGQPKNNKYKYNLYLNNNVLPLISMEDYTSNTYYTFDDIRKKISVADTNQSYKITVIRNDGIEDSEETEIAAPETWFIPAIPKIETYSNSFGQKIDILSKDGKLLFEKEVKLEFSDDTGYAWIDSMGASTKIGKTVIYEIDTSATQEYAYNTDFDFSLTFYNNDGEALYGKGLEEGQLYQHKYMLPLKKIQKIDNSFLSSNEVLFEFGHDEYCVYIHGAESETTTINFYNFISNGSEINDELLTPYGLTVDSQINYCLIHKDNNDKISEEMSINIKDLNVEENTTLSIPVIFYKENGQESQDSIYYNLKSDYKNHNDTFDAQVLFEIKNVFGNDILFTGDAAGAKSEIFTMTYEVEPIIEEFKLFTQKENSSDRIELGQMANYYLKEKSQLWIRLKISTYNSNPEFQLISEKNNNLSEEPYNTISFIGSEKPSPGNPITYTYEGLISTFKSISEDYENYFKVNIKTDAANAPINNFYYGWTSETETQIEKNKILIYNKKHTNPSASISNSNYDEKTKTISLEAILQSNGIWSEEFLVSPTFCGIKVELLFREPDNSYDSEEAIVIIEKNPTDKNEDFTLGLLKCNYDMKQISSGYIKLKITTYLRDPNGWFETAYFVETNEISVFNINPTVAYRKNYLGINTRDFFVTIDEEEKNDGVVYISNTEDRPCIYLKSSEGSIRIINIITGEMDGFVLEGGTW